MKKTLIALSCFLLSTTGYAHDNETKGSYGLYEYPSPETGMFFFTCTSGIATIPGMVQKIGPIENAIRICSCILDKFRSTYTHEQMTQLNNTEWLKGESQRFGYECYVEFFDKESKNAPMIPLKLNETI